MARNPQNTDTLIEAVTRLQSGDKAALESILEQCQERLYYYALKMTGNPADAEEVVQEVFVTVLEKIGTLREPGSFLPWVFTTAKNLCFLKLRGRRKDQDATVSLEDYMPRFNRGHIGAVEDWSDRVESGALSKELARHLDAAIQKLPIEYREILLLRDVQGLSAEEAGKVCGLSVAAVKSRLHRARLFVRENLSQYLTGAGTKQASWE
ncbi:MAG: RNA polymerase sigma factor [Candidatus Tectomicrobia bacterium]|uniref:RNA polymerase sigma factor n=1 Tax=Tectimicrobiota bacterium TaxID=2528274 RepID=A0A932M0V5_UNCTE|nr:RNA polymerase sigma factor [Candidatus Tectomicrobia bacterium]